MARTAASGCTASFPAPAVAAGAVELSRPPRSWRRTALGLLAGSVLLAVGASNAQAARPTPEQILRIQPRQQGVSFTSPAADKVARCKVDLEKAERGSGWVLKDDEGNVLRRFMDLNGDNRLDVWSYYKDGVEVYREIDTTQAAPYKPNEYRWFNSGGSKWGVDEDKDGRIEYWKVISPEEVSQEILQALVHKDLARLQALMLSDGELKALDLPEEVVNRIREQQKGVPEKFQQTVGKLTKLSPKASWIHLETSVPQCQPAGQTGLRQDLVKHAWGTILYETGGGNDWIQTGEMIQVGQAWRIVSAPEPGASVPRPAIAPGAQVNPLEDNPVLQKLIQELTDLDKKAPRSQGGPDPDVARHHLRRADQLEKIVGQVKAQMRDPWIRQVADSLSTAAQSSAASDHSALDRLINLEKQLVSYMPGSNLAAYVTFREMQADYSSKINPDKVDNKSFNKLQEAWLERLGKFVQTYPKADDTPDALLQAGMVSEFLSKEVEAKNWYNQLVQNFPSKPQAAKAKGAIRRIDCEGKVMRLAGPLLSDPNVSFDVDQMRGKVVVVYYWASWNTQASGEFSKLKQLMDSYGSKGLDLVSVNLDNTIEEARSYLSSTPAPGTHLYQTGGLEGKLATDYGIMVLPNVFLVGKDGTIISRSIQIANLEDEVKKQLKK